MSAFLVCFNRSWRSKVYSTCQTEKKYWKVVGWYCWALMWLSIPGKQPGDLNKCCIFVYRRVFGFNVGESVKTFIWGLGRLNFFHLHNIKKTFNNSQFGKFARIISELLYFHEHEYVLSLLNYVITYAGIHSRRLSPIGFTVTWFWFRFYFVTYLHIVFYNQCLTLWVIKEYAN